MDEIRTDKTPTGTHTTISKSDTKPAGGNGVMWFLLGGIVVVLAIAGYFVMRDDGLMSSDAVEPAGGNVSINVDTDDAPAASAPTEAAPAETAPTEEAAPTETAPAPAETDTQAD